MNWVWLGFNLLLILPATVSAGLVGLVIDLGAESLLGPFGASVVLVTPFLMAVYVKKYRRDFLKAVLILLNLVALIYAGEGLFHYWRPSTNAMWMVAVFPSVIWFAGAGINLWSLLPSPLTRQSHRC